MINPSDLFNAHRVVSNPTSYRPTRILKPMILPRPMTLREASRRGVLVRSVRRAASDQAASVRAVIVRDILPRIRKR